MRLKELLLNNDPPLLEMANLYSHETGLEYGIWIGKIGGQHGPRLKVSNVKGRWRANDNFTISIEEEPKLKSKREYMKIPMYDYNQVVKWIQINFDRLMTLWWMFEHNAVEVYDEESEKSIKMDDIFDELEKV
jgi:hypothetical protein